MAECIVCQEIVSYQKFLSCGSANKKHMLCLICIQRLTKNGGSADEKVVECPLCRMLTKLPFGDANKLETKLYVKLVCDDCSEYKSIEDQRWCKSCQLTTCSKCAMERHRLHNSNLWEKYEMPREIVRYFKSRFKRVDFPNIKAERKIFCKQLEMKLLKKIENIENAFTFVNAIENCFGNLNTGPIMNKTDLLNFEKKFKTLCHILNLTKRANKGVLEQPTNVENIEHDLVFLPRPDEAIDLFQNEQKDKDIAFFKGLISGLVCFAIYSVFFPISHYHAPHSYPMNSNSTYTKFLPEYSDGKLISEINIAATHNSLARMEGFGKFTRCQEWDLRKQLDNGIRFIDIRLRHINNGLAAHHGPVFQEIDFPTVMNTVHDFLNANAGEFVLMSIKEEHTPEGNNEGFDVSVKKVLNQHADHWWRGTDNNPRVGKIRGKFIVVQRFNSGERMGIPWNDFGDKQNIFETTIENKVGFINDQLSLALEGDKNKIYVNFINVFRFPRSTPQADSALLNYYLNYKLKEIDQLFDKRVGIIVMDFPDHDIIRMLNKCQVQH